MSKENYNYTVMDRVNYYLGNTKEKKWNIIFDEDIETFRDCDTDKEYTDICNNHYSTNLINKEDKIEHFKKIYLNKNGVKTISYGEAIFEYNKISYIEPMIELFNSDEYFKEKNFLIRPGDVYFHTDVPIITKTRPLGNSYNVLVNVDSKRHWNECSNVDKYDIPFTEKNNKIIWRGATNGFLFSTTRPSRFVLCKKYYNHENNMIDIGFSSSQYETTKEYIKPLLSVEEQLKSKFLISLEGGDVATNLKWMLYSNSVVLMPHPTMVSWAMEDTLQPWIHYIPLEKDFDDLEEKYNWCLNNLDKCEQIAKNGKEFIKQFLDEEREKTITNMVLREYVDNVNICHGKSKYGLGNAIIPTRVNN